MIFKKSDNPGSHERHLLRRNNNPLFQTRQSELNDDSMMVAQEKDHNEILKFHEGFKKVLNDTINLKPNEESDVILELKNRLEALYEQAHRIGDDQSETKAALKKLLDVIMVSIRKGAGNDVQAHQELDQEETARKAHFELLESPLVADILNPDSVISEDDLVPCLLSSSKDELSKVLQLFDQTQLISIAVRADELITTLLKEKQNIPEAIENLIFIQGYIEYISNMERDSGE